MAYKYERRMVSIFDQGNLSILFLKHFIDLTPYSRSTYWVQPIYTVANLMFHTYFGLSFIFITLQVTWILTCGREFYYLANHFTTIMQGCYNSTRSWKSCMTCHNLLTTLSQPYKIVARLPQTRIFYIRRYSVFSTNYT